MSNPDGICMYVKWGYASYGTYFDSTTGTFGGTGGANLSTTHVKLDYNTSSYGFRVTALTTGTYIHTYPSASTITVGKLTAGQYVDTGLTGEKLALMIYLGS